MLDWALRQRCIQALEYYANSLKITLQTVGAEHPSVGATYNNMANVYANQGKCEEARPRRLKVLGLETTVESTWSLLGSG